MPIGPWHSAILRLDRCIVWNEHNTVFNSKTICAQAVYFLHATSV